MTSLIHGPLDIASDLDAFEVSDDLVPARLIDAAIRAALGAGSDIVFVPGHGPNTPSENLGAILRF